jgi:hypothetical protein
MPTLYEHRCLHCGSHGHEGSACPHSQQQNDCSPKASPSKGNKSLPEQSGVGVDEKPSNRFGKEDVELEIQDEESLKNY